MKKYLIVAKESEDGLWAQFTINEPLGPKEVKIYENVVYEGLQGTIKADNVKLNLMSKNENKYKISVVIPTLNRINTLQRALDSVINQTYKPAEIIVVDNGSSDGTLKFLREQYPKITILTENKIGVSSARNKGIKKSIKKI